MKVKVLVVQLCPTLCNPMDYSPPGSSSPGKNTGVGCHALLQGIFLTQGSNIASYIACNGRQDFFNSSATISHKYTYIPSLLSLPPLSPSHSSRSSQSTRLGSQCYTATSHQLSVLPVNVVFIELLYSNTAYWTTLFPPDFSYNFTRNCGKTVKIKFKLIFHWPKWFYM